MVTLTLKPIMPLDPFLNFMADPPVFSDDPVALSCASYRLWRTTGERFARLERLTPEPEDRAMAEALKLYYREKTQDTLFLTLKAVKGQAVSDFRRKLHLISMDRLMITQAELGLVYRLPYFYHEDLAIDRVVASTISTVPRPEHQPGSAVRETWCLQPLQRIFKSRKHSETWQFWFTDSDKEAYMLSLHRDNPLLQMFDTLFDKHELTLEFVRFQRSLRYPSHWYHQIYQPKLAYV